MLYSSAAINDHVNLNLLLYRFHHSYYIPEAENLSKVIEIDALIGCALSGWIGRG